MSSSISAWDEQDWRDHYEERAAIIEYDGQRSRQSAELAAQVEVRRLRSGRTSRSVRDWMPPA